jgi:hypothetical protein
MALPVFARRHLRVSLFLYLPFQQDAYLVARIFMNKTPSAFFSTTQDREKIVDHLFDL